MNNTGFQVGDEIEIELPDGSTHDLTVVGLVSDQTSARPDAKVTSNAYVTLEQRSSHWGWALFQPSLCHGGGGWQQ